jgi:catechol 2,3-dioxygenase-like lactoylglutathione lyase family enzyme
MLKGVAAVWLPVTDMDRAVAFYGETLGRDLRAPVGPDRDLQGP